MWTPAKLANAQNARVYDELYGFGWELFDVRGRAVVGPRNCVKYAPPICCFCVP